MKKHKKVFNFLNLGFLLGICGPLLASCNSETVTSQSNASSDSGISVAIDSEDFDLYVGETKQLNATASVDGLMISWSSNDADVATVSNGLVTGLSEGYAEITASIENVTKTSIFVHVIEKIEPIDYTPTLTIQEGYGEELDVFNILDEDDIDLTKGLVGKDYLGNNLPIQIVDLGGFQSHTLGSYKVQYKVVDEDNDLTATLTRKVNVTYFGIKKETLNSLETSNMHSWTYVPDQNNYLTASEWGQHVVPGHNADWNKFEGPFDEETQNYMNCIIMHGSDTNGHGCDGIFEEEDEYPNTILFNKITVTEENPIFHLHCSVNPYPDYNNMISKFRFSVMNPETYAVTSSEYREQKAPITASGDSLDFDAVRNNIYEDIDLSDYIGQTIILMIEQDSSNNVYQEEFYLDIGYQEFQISTLISETRDTFVVYDMAFVASTLQHSICGFNDTEWRNLPLDNSTSWGDYASEDPNVFGLRNDLDSLKKWSWYTNSGKQNISNRSGGYATQFVSWATCPEEINDGVAEQCFANRVIVSEKYFLFMAGTDEDVNMINVRFNLITPTGFIHSIEPAKYTQGEYTPLTNSWGRIQKSQWVFGTSLYYDLSDYLNDEVTIVIETDQAAEANPTIWLDAFAFVENK